MEGGKERGGLSQGISLGVAVQVVFIEDACKGGGGGEGERREERGRRDGAEGWRIVPGGVSP